MLTTSDGISARPVESVFGPGILDQIQARAETAARILRGQDEKEREQADSEEPTSRGDRPPRRTVRARRPLDPADFAANSHVDPDCYEVLIAQDLFATHHGEALSYVMRLRRMAQLWDEDSVDGDLNAILLADARRTTIPRASRMMRDAYRAVCHLHRVLERMEKGHLPVEWFEILLRRTRGLEDDEIAIVDEYVADWDLANIPITRFLRELSILLAWFRKHSDSSPFEKRSVEVVIDPSDDGTACLMVTGPIHEILSVSRRLDVAARAVQRQQRHAVVEGEPIPFDLDGEAERSGRRLPLSKIRYAILTGTVLETPGVEVDGSRFRMEVVVPMMSMLGLSDAPGLIDGTIPIPASLAREIAADEPTWYRILTDPATGEFLPLPADRYTPTKQMAEFLRLRNPLCAVPGCTRSVGTFGEMDHIEEFDHRHPERGGPTSIENLHRLCGHHHQLKTFGLIDIERNPDGTSTWIVGTHRIEDVEDSCDLLTPELAADLMRSWEDLVERRFDRELRAIRHAYPDAEPSDLLRLLEKHADDPLPDPPEPRPERELALAAGPPPF
ncbi:HNH endonuclease signature motif containing protein [Brachybacterium sp. DNPG3]